MTSPPGQKEERKGLIIIKKDDCNKLGEFFAAHLYDWCIENKVRVIEPRNPNTKKYDVFEIHINTPRKMKKFTTDYGIHFKSICPQL